MLPGDVPQELIDILDAHAGRTHSRDGSVVRALAEILTRYDEMHAGRVEQRTEPARLVVDGNVIK